jgi:hypothetical protein
VTFGIYVYDAAVFTGLIDGLVNSGTIHGINANAINTNSLSNFTNTADGTVESDGQDAINVTGGNLFEFAVTNFTNAGMILAHNSTSLALRVNGGGVQNFRNLAGATIEATGIAGTAVSIDGNVDGFHNAGTIQANGYAIWIGGTTEDFVNTGTIGVSGGEAIAVFTILVLC